MMVPVLPSDPNALLAADWAVFEPYYQELQQRSLDAGNVDSWLADWSRVTDCIEELESRLVVLVASNTADAQAEQHYNAFYDGIYPQVKAVEQALKEKLLSSGIQPAGYEIPLRNMRAQADLFCAENLPLLSEENKLKTEYDKIIGAQTILWEGEERTISQVEVVLQDPNRETRERAWRQIAARQLADREAINEVWVKLLGLRQQLAKNAGRPSYRAYRWQELLRFDYTPEDARSFQNAIEEVVVPAAQRVYERRRRRLGLESLRPWDLDVDASGLPALRPFDNIETLKSGVSTIFQRVDAELSEYFDVMVRENLLDLENRKNKAPGAFCTGYPVIERPFIFMNAVGTHDNLQTLLHESGHAFHVFESAHLSNFQRSVPMEFAEVASMSMELLTAPYLTREQGGFYTPAEAARARIEHLEGSICFWPYMAVVDAFQHWAYENAQAAADPAQCDACWADLWGRFMKGVDWGGLEDGMATGWHRKVHLYGYPFYYIEYGLALLGAVQVWSRALQDPASAVKSYRKALSLGGTASLPELFRAAGARFAFDAPALREAVELMETQISRLTQLL